MASSHFDNDLTRFLQQTAEYFEIDEVDHVFSRRNAANDENVNARFPSENDALDHV